MSNKISRRTFLKVTGASAAALGAAAVLGGCQAGDNSSIEVKVGDKISNWNNLAVQLTSVFTLASAPDAEGYEYIAMLITSANRSSRDTFAIGAPERCRGRERPLLPCHDHREPDPGIPAVHPQPAESGQDQRDPCARPGPQPVSFCVKLLLILCPGPCNFR